MKERQIKLVRLIRMAIKDPIGAAYESIKSHPDLSDEQKTEYANNLRKATESFTPAIHDIIRKNVSNFVFHPHVKHIYPSVLMEHIEHPELAEDIKDQFRQLQKGEPQHAGGMYSRVIHSIHVNGKINPSKERSGEHGSFHHAADIYTHELGHAVDGPNWQYSDDPEWIDAWEKEVYPKRGPNWDHPITKYAAQDPIEGFAEAFRMFHGTNRIDHAKAKKKFPKVFEFFEKHGLLPDAKVQEKTNLKRLSDMPEIFTHKKIMPDGSHADCVK